MYTCAQEDESLRTYMTGWELQNISQMYNCYINKERWPTQLTEALARETLKIETGLYLHMLGDTVDDEI